MSDLVNGSDQSIKIVDVPIVILAGGQGTRLRSVVGELPKLLAPIGNKPFLEILLSWLEHQGAREVVFSLGYQSEKIIKALQQRNNLNKLVISYVVEPEPLGTLGGLSYCLNNKKIEECLVINGDTFVDVQLLDFLNQQRANKAFSALVTKHVSDTSRYGRIEFKNKTNVLSFVEKDLSIKISGWINAGVYYFSAPASEQISVSKEGSIETGFLARIVDRLTYFKCEYGRFIDIGTPQSYAQAKEVLKEYLE